MNVYEWLFGNKLIWSHFATNDCNDWTSLIALLATHSWETSAINMGSLNAVKLMKYLLIKLMIKIITRNLWISECLIYFTSCSEHWSRPSDTILVRHGSLNKDPHTTLNAWLMETYHFGKYHFEFDYKIIFERSYSINGNITLDMTTWILQSWEKLVAPPHTYLHWTQSQAYSDIESTCYQNSEWQIDKTVLHITK